MTRRVHDYGGFYSPLTCVPYVYLFPSRDITKAIQNPLTITVISYGCSTTALRAANLHALGMIFPAQMIPHPDSNIPPDRVISAFIQLQ